MACNHEHTLVGPVEEQTWGVGFAFADADIVPYAARLYCHLAPPDCTVTMHCLLVPPHCPASLYRRTGDRWSADHYLTSWPRQLFSAHFSDVLHPFFARLLPLDSDARLAAVAGNFAQLAAAVQGTAAAAGGGIEAYGGSRKGQHASGVRVSVLCEAPDSYSHAGSIEPIDSSVSGS